jgi:23S rRNA (uracil-5-)-methyltransferase RumA
VTETTTGTTIGTDDQWWVGEVLYQIYPRSYQDTDGDGVGDLRGIIERLDHLAWLGIRAIWLSPVTVSPNADFGYDVADYCDVDPSLGTLADLDELIAAAAALRGWECVYDLYCGIGSIGLSLAARAGTVHGLEINEDAVADAIDNARHNEITNASFYAGDVRLALGELVARAGRPDVVVVDPPRAGLSQKIVRRVIEAAPKRIVYVSCNPTTLAPNAAQLVEAGWRLERVTPVDMFPQTPHIECVAVLTR